MENLELTQEWDKVFPKSNKVDHQKITFHNRYGITLAADMYTPKNAAGKLSAIAVSGPFGAVKEQSSGLYAQTMAEFGFLTIAFDPSFTGESGGSPRYVASPDINTEDFCAAVDFLSVQENVDSDRIGIIGICGWGGMAHRPLELVSGDFAPWDEIFQWYIISYPDFLMEHADEPVFHDEELDLYVWGITHFGTGWDCVPAPEIR